MTGASPISKPFFVYAESHLRGTLDFEVSQHLSEENGITRQLYIKGG